MENDKKYYIPSIEELCIGFEHEFLATKPKEFFPDIIKNVHDLINVVEESILNPERFRVKYLDKEDIESTCFFFEKNQFGVNDIYEYSDKYVNKYQLTHNIERGYINIQLCEAKPMPIWIFQGKVKNRAELKKIIQQLGINE